MSLSDLAELGSFISGIAVLISLAFLYIQLRQMNSQVRQAEKYQVATIRHGRASRAVEVFLAAADPSVSEAIERVSSGTDEITTVQLQQFRNFFTAYYNHAEDSFYQHREGLLSNEAFELLVFGLRWTMRAPGYRAAWKQMFSRRKDEFGQFIQNFVEETPTLERGDTLTEWKHTLSEVRAGPKRTS